MSGDEMIIVNVNLRITVSKRDYETAYGPALKRDIREWVKATVYEHIEEGQTFPSDVPVSVEEIR